MVVIPTKMGLINRRTLISRLQRIGIASRADLAKSLGLSQPTVGKIAHELLRQGVLEVVETKEGDESAVDETDKKEEAKLGRPGILLRLDRRHPRFLCIQLDVTETCLAAMPVGVDTEDKWQVRVPTLRSVTDWKEQLKEASQKIEQKQFWGILVSVPGIVDEENGKVIFSPNLHWTERANLARAINSVWDAPVTLVQEERALALGHQCLDENSEDFLLVDFGEGVGGAAIVNGKLYTNRLPLSGELGHTPVCGNRRECGCGASGCLETIVSKRGLMMSLSEVLQKEVKDWRQVVNHIAQNGIEEWLDKTLEQTAVVIAGALNVMGLRRVVITGILNELPSAVVAELGRKIQKGAMWARFGDIECLPAPRRRIAGLVAVGIEKFVAPVGTEKPVLKNI